MAPPASSVRSPLSLSFYGAAGLVTGSRFVVRAGNDQVLVDCGLFQGGRYERQLNWQPPGFDPRRLAGAIITHAHLDHCGYLPRLVRGGFNGKVYCTPPTARLIPIVLRDAATLEEEDAEYANRKGYSRHRPAHPLFTVADAELAIRKLRGVAHQRVGNVAGFRFRFHHAGHILGAAVVELWHETDPGHRLVFSGDLGRHDVPLHIDPDPRPECRTLVLESTYGDELHPPREMKATVREAVEPTLRQGGVVLMPAFAVARAQLLALVLQELMVEGELPPVPIHIDSPMAVGVTDIYEDYEGTLELDPRRKELARVPDAVLHRTRAESRALAGLRGPAIIIASSGMLAGGRVLHHLRWVAPSARHAIVLTGYQAEGTRGRALLDGARVLRIHGTTVPVEARVISLAGLSAHADQDGLLAWAAEPPPPETVFLVHGEPMAAAALGARLADARIQYFLPDLHDRFDYVDGAWRRRR